MIKRYKLLKQNAPKVFNDFSLKRKVKLMARLKEMRLLWEKEKDDLKKQEIKKVGENVKNELEVLNKLSNEV